MKIPKHIRDKMHRVAELNRKAGVLAAEVDVWFEERGFDINLLRCGNGFSLEELDYGNDITNILCEYIENENFGRANDDRGAE